jgi:murein DD-endopeptidase MepM/ murein hydrolase activator NlpD
MNEYYTRKRPRPDEARPKDGGSSRSGHGIFLTGFQIVVCVICIAAAFGFKQFGGQYYTIARAYVVDAFKYSVTGDDVVQAFQNIREKWFPDAAEVFSKGVTSSSANTSSKNTISGNTSSSSSPKSGASSAAGPSKTKSSAAANASSAKSTSSAPLIAGGGTTAAVLPTGIYSFTHTNCAPKIDSLAVLGRQTVSKTASFSPYLFTVKPVFPVKGWMSSPFGYRINPITKKQDFHTGVDIAAPAGTPILASFSGRVEKAGQSTYYGNNLLLDNGNGVKTFYGHCKTLLVKKGQQVKAGDTIALVGSTGASTGNHLHFEISIRNISVNPQWSVSATTA